MKIRWGDPRQGGMLVTAAVILALPLFLPNPFYYDVVIRIGMNAIMVVGLNLLIGYAGQISLGHAGFLALGAYASGILTGRYGWPPIAAMAAGMAGVGILAYVLARPILKLKGHYLAMATLGMGIIIFIVLTQESQWTGGPDGMSVPAFSLLGRELSGEKNWYWVTGALLMLALWLALNVIDSPVGRALRALHGSEVAAQVAGVDTSHFKVLVFVLSAVIASATGSLMAHYIGFITPTVSSFFHSIELVTMVVVGGMASIFGSVVGAAILTMLPQLLSGFEGFELVAFGAILMLTMIFMPRGLVPTLAAKLRRA
ncbi:MAG: branched-chain amino acid ABC transporter permease [Betaproteobacteria bacterium]|nr:branched-chain amino acid ABC transporter permease [Betaproteobacteria bacterium]